MVDGHAATIGGLSLARGAMPPAARDPHRPGRCGNRGPARGQCHERGPRRRLVAMADIFPHHVSESREMLKKESRSSPGDEAHCFSGRTFNT